MTPKMSGFIKLENYSFNNVCSNKCAMCLKIFKWIPVVFIAALLSWSYYAFVIQLAINSIDSPYIFKKIVYLLIYHGLLVMFVWSYWQTIFTEMGPVPSQFKVPPADAERIEKDTDPESQRQLLERYAKDLPILMRTMNGGYRYCGECHHLKPDRAHHCSVCKMCILKMDHHCPWVNNCVSFTNYKFFLLFLGYGLLYCTFIAATTLEYFILFWKNDLQDVGRFHILFLFFVALMFAISLGFLYGYHLFLVLVNRSTLESFRAPMFRLGPDKNGFSLGRMANFQEVFGEDRRYWLLPIFTSLGDGVLYPTRSQGSSYHSMGVTASSHQQPSQGEGVSFPERPIAEDQGGLLGVRAAISPDTSEEEECPYNKGDHSDVKMANVLHSTT